MSYTIDSDHNLFSVEALKAYLDIKTADHNDEMGRIVDAVSYYLRARNNRTQLKADDITEFYDGNGTATLFTRNYPINSTSATIEIYIDTDTPRSYGSGDKVSANSILLYSEEGWIVLLDAAFSEAPQSVKIVYNAGYATIPPDLQQAALELGAVAWKREKQQLQSLSSVSVAGGSVTFNFDQVMPTWVKDAVGRYWRPA